MSKIMVALGGNAILRHKEKGTAEEQLGHIRETSKHLAEMIKAGHELVVTHGNGPQVGDVLLKNDIAKDKLPPMPLDICGAETQGMIGYMMQRSLDQEFHLRGIKKAVATVVTQTRVDKRDPAFETPTKFIGPFYTALEAKQLRSDKGWSVIADGDRGFRRVVPSPEPIDVLELPSIKALFEGGTLVIAGGGGGVPIVEDSRGEVSGVEAVIDKDHTAALMARLLKVDVLLILTDVAAAALDFGKPNQKDLRDVSIHQAKEYFKMGQFAKGSMGPKVDSCMRFVEKTGGKAIITSLEHAKDALEGNAGTHFRP
jgi:carbamate kinase